MKRSHLILACICFLSTQAFAQNLPRFFDNFDTARGVQVQRPTMAAAVTAKTTNKKLVKKTSQTQSRMNVSDGFARPQDVYRADRLMMGTAVGMKGFTTGDAMMAPTTAADARTRRSMERAWRRWRGSVPRVVRAPNTATPKI